MTISTYKKYTIETVGISRYIYRPGASLSNYAPGYEQSLAAAKRWINEDIKKREVAK